MSTKRIEDDGPDVQGWAEPAYRPMWTVGLVCSVAGCHADALWWVAVGGASAPRCTAHTSGMAEGGPIEDAPQPLPRFSPHTPGVVPQHLGGPTDDHYACLAVQPIEATEAWSQTWPGGIAYHLGEAVAAIARCGTKGQTLRDIKKAAWLLSRAVAVLEGTTRAQPGKSS